MAVTSKVQLGLAAVLHAGTGAAAGVMLSDRALQAAAVPAIVSGPAFAPLAGAPASLADMVEAVGPSGVQIQIKPDAGMMQRMAYGDEGNFGGQMPGDLQDRLRDLFGDALRGRSGPEQGPQGPPQAGVLGSGFIVDA